MRPSLIAIDRYDPERAAARFTSRYDPANTTCIVVSGKTVGFYVLIAFNDHLLLDHFYIQPEAQGNGIGTSIIKTIKKISSSNKKPLKLSALRGSESNAFYKRNSFVETHQTEFDIHYPYTP